MNTLNLTTEELQEFADEEELDVEVTNGYSGRAMHGDTCLGVIGPEQEIEQFKMTLGFHCGYCLGHGSRTRVNDALYELYEATNTGHRTDNMGQDLIAYWPGVKLSDGDDR